MFLQRKHDGARGPAAARHAAARSEEVWRTADREIFAALRDTLPLSLYCAMFDGENQALVQRAAIIQRASVYARRCDWDVAMIDFIAAASLCPETSLTPLEWDITLRAMGGKHGAADAFSTKMRNQIKALAAKGPVGKTLSRALARGARWRLRAAVNDRDPGAAARVARFLADVGIGHGRPTASNVALQERSTLPREAYLW
jgi:hypothetical protein